MMEEFRDDPTNRLNKNEQNWITYLIDGFRARYDNWVSAEASYLEALYRKRWPLVLFAGHAYLHIGFDLPVVIAESLMTNEDARQPLVRPSRGSQIFGQLERSLEKALRADWKKPWTVRTALNHNMDDQLLNWVVGLRNTSWKHAMEIADALPEDRSRIIDGLHDDLQARLKKALSISMPLLLVLALRPPRTPVPVFVGIEVALWFLLNEWLGYETATAVVIVVLGARMLFHSAEDHAASIVRVFFRRFAPPVHKK